MSASKNDSGLYEIEIDGLRYEFEKWGAEESLLTLLKISKIAGKPIAAAISALTGGVKEETLFESKAALDMKIKPEIIGMIIESLTSNLDEAVCISLIKKFSSEKVLCDGAKINFSKHYEDRLDHAFKVVHAGLAVQYGNFLSALLGVLPVKGSVKLKVQGVMNRGM